MDWVWVEEERVTQTLRMWGLAVGSGWKTAGGKGLGGRSGFGFGLAEFETSVRHSPFFPQRLFAHLYNGR